MVSYRHNMIVCSYSNVELITIAYLERRTKHLVQFKTFLESLINYL